MKRFNLLIILLFIAISFIGCEKKPIGTVSKMHWDRDMCERCKMAISERKYAVQVINAKTGKTYKFDDIGCAVLWLDEEKIPWSDKAIFWITDAKTGSWIDAKKAIYTDDSITPMAFGFAAYTKESLPKNHSTISFDEVSRIVFEIEKLNQEKGQN